MKLNRKLEKKWFQPVKKALDKKVSSLIQKVKDNGLQAGILYLQIDLANHHLTKVIEQLYVTVGLIHARKEEIRLRKEIKKDRVSKSVPVGMEVKRIGYAQSWIDFIRNYLKLFLIAKITFKVNEYTRDKLIKVVQEAIDKGWGIDETVKHLEDLPLTSYQAARIVRTEINRASNVGVNAQGETFEYELMKEWISVKDNRTRGRNPNDHADHYHLDGQTVDFEGKFKDPRNGHELRHPGDPEAEAEDVINCRCNHTTKPKRNEQGRLILKNNVQRLAA